MVNTRECPYASPIVVVAKKDDILRMCVDYRHLKKRTIKDAYPLPRIDEIITSLHNAYCFVALHLLMGYQQIHVGAEDRQKTGLITHKGLFVFKLMPFWLCKAPATFQRWIDGIFAEPIGQDLAANLDDLLMYALRHA